MKEFKWQKEKIGKYIRYLGVLNIFFTILLGSFVNSNKVYADIHQRIDSAHYYVSVNAYGSSSDVTFTWAPMSETNGIIDVVTYKLTSSSNNVSYVLVMYGEGSVSLSGINATSVSITSQTYYQIDTFRDDISGLGQTINSINSYINQIWNSTSSIESYTLFINNHTYEIEQLVSDLVNDFDIYSSQIGTRILNIYNYLNNGIIYDYSPENIFAINYFVNNGFIINASSGNMYYGLYNRFSNVRMTKGTYQNDISLTRYNSLYTFIGQPSVLIFASDYSDSLYNSTISSDVTGFEKIYRSYTDGTYTYHLFIVNRSKGTNGSYQFRFNFGSSVKLPEGTVPNALINSVILPLYYGPLNTCPYLDLFGLSSEQAQQMENNASDLNNLSNSISGTEEYLNTQFNTNLDNVDTTSGTNFVGNNRLIVSSNWVRNRFNEIINNNPMGDLLTFSLLFGLALLLIGRIL